MKIQVDRVNQENGDLVFTITVSDPHKIPFGSAEREIMETMKTFQIMVNLQEYEDYSMKESVITASSNIQKRVFDKCIDMLKNDINGKFLPRHEHICQEIYNWLYDHQTDELKAWLTEFDAQRTRYYFDNDITPESNPEPQESEHEDEDDEDGWEDN